MENIRRKIKIFWLEHSDPIIFYTIVIVAVIAIVQILNQMAIKKDKQEKQQYQNNKNTVNNEVVVKYKEDKNNTELINTFINFCKETKIEEAYELLSEDCKRKLYPTIEAFKNKYYNKIFIKKLDIQVDHNSKDNIYSIQFFEDALESGKIENRNNILDHYKVLKEVEKKVIYINFYNEIS